jgi:hypothetical protein
MGTSRQIKAYRCQLQAWNLSYGGAISIPSLRSNAIGHHIGQLFGLLLLLLIGASLLGPIANATTGITVAHTGFTPNPNVTGTPGFVPLIQVIPLVFIGVLLGYGLDELTAVL